MPRKSQLPHLVCSLCGTELNEQATVCCEGCFTITCVNFKRIVEDYQNRVDELQLKLWNVESEIAGLESIACNREAIDSDKHKP